MVAVCDDPSDSLPRSRVMTPGTRATAIPRIISVDDHVVEPPHVSTSRVPARYRDLAPRLARRGLGNLRYGGGTADEDEQAGAGPRRATWFCEGRRYPHKR